MIQYATDGSGISAATYKQQEIFTLEFAWLTENEKPVSANPLSGGQRPLLDGHILDRTLFR